MLDDKDTFAKRFGRYTQVGMKASHIAGRYALDKLGGASTDEQRAALLFEALSNLRGPLIKVPQLLATIPDFLPPAYQEKFMNLQARVPPMGTLFVKRRMGSELGPDWQKNFQYFDLQASFAASLGQVHKATLRDGTPVACKLQYPDMTSAVAADLNQFRALLALYQKTNKAIDAQDVLAEITEHITQELDYQREAKNMAAFAHIFSQSNHVQVPSPYGSLSTGRLLVMDWCEGTPISNFASAPQQTRNLLAERLFDAWYKPFFTFGVIHGDPHMGNYTVAPDHRLNLLDFGCIRYFEPSMVQGVIDLYRALLTNNTQRAREAYRLWGFDSISKELLETLNQWAKYLYGPVLIDREVDLQKEFPSQQGQQVASAVMEQLQKQGGIRPPRSFVFMDRAAVGVGSVFLRLGAKLNWHTLYEGYIAQFSKKKMTLNRPNMSIS